MSKYDQILEDLTEIPKIGDVIRTKKMQMEGKVERLGTNRAGYPEVFFRIEDGRLMKAPADNVIVIEKLADEDHEMLESMLHEISNEVLAKYKKAAGADATKADKEGNTKRADKRFKGIVKATKKEFDNDAKKVDEGEVIQFPGKYRKTEPKWGYRYTGKIVFMDDIVYPMIKKHNLDMTIAGHDYNDDSGDVSTTVIFYTDDQAGVLDRHIAAMAAKYGNVDNIYYGYKKVRIDNVDEGTMGGINRSAPATDVSYEQTLEPNPESKYSRVVGEDKILDAVMEKWKQTNEAEGDEFKKILKTQHKEKGPKKPTDEKDYNGWKVRYDLIPSKPGAPYRWMAWHAKGSPDSGGKGTALSPKDAWDDATAWINSGGGIQDKVSGKATIDFNRDFCHQYAPDGEPFYAKIDGGYLLMSTMPAEGFRKSGPRAVGNVVFQCMPISAEECQASNLKPNGRYAVGELEEIQPGVAMFPLHFQGTVAHSGDRLQMGIPGFTVATFRAK